MVCSPEMLDTLEKFVDDMGMGEIADAVVTLGGTYLNCEKYNPAREKFEQALTLPNTDSNCIAKLIAKYGLVVIDFKTQEINEDAYKNKTEEIGEEINDRLGEIPTLQCNCEDSIGRPGTQRNRVCIVRCD